MEFGVGNICVCLRACVAAVVHTTAHNSCFSGCVDPEISNPLQLCVGWISVELYWDLCWFLSPPSLT